MFSVLVRTILPLVMVIAFIYTAGTVVKVVYSCSIFIDDVYSLLLGIGVGQRRTSEGNDENDGLGQLASRARLVHQAIQLQFHFRRSHDTSRRCKIKCQLPNVSIDNDVIFFFSLEMFSKRVTDFSSSCSSSSLSWRA